MAGPLLLVNAHARRGRSTDVASGRDMDVEFIDDPAELAGRLRAARGRERIIVAGGDGTVSAAADVLAGSQTCLGIVPLGTHNDFARSLGLPADPEEALQVALHASPSPVDLGIADGRHFANALTLGISGRVARDTPPALKRALGPVAYGVTAANAIAQAKPFRCTLRWPEGEQVLETHQIVIANGSTLGRAEPAPDSGPQDGMLSVRSVGDATRTGLVASWLQALPPSATIDERSFHFRTSSVHVETDPAIPVDLDGELGPKTPVHVGIERGTLRVAMPAKD